MGCTKQNLVGQWNLSSPMLASILISRPRTFPLFPTSSLEPGTLSGPAITDHCFIHLQAEFLRAKHPRMVTTFHILLQWPFSLPTARPRIDPTQTSKIAPSFQWIRSFYQIFSLTSILKHSGTLYSSHSLLLHFHSKRDSRDVMFSMFSTIQYHSSPIVGVYV